ncbi:hypothetical protein VTO42DRAFT_6910 [Malbranchea cinnamomea]
MAVVYYLEIRPLTDHNSPLFSTNLRIITTPTTSVYVGPEKEEFSLHLGAAARVSQKLHDLLRSNLTCKSRLWLKDIDGETFARVAQYLYTYDYAEPEPKVEETHLKSEDVGSDPVDAWSSAAWSLGHFTPESSSAKNDTGLVPVPDAWSDFLSKRFSCVNPFQSLHRAQKNKDEDYRPVFLGHAKVYVFAKNYDIDGLSILALKKIHNILCGFHLYPERVGDIVELSKFADENAKGSPTEPLRELVLEYMACKIEHIVDRPEIKLLFSKGPRSLMADLFRLMAARLKGKNTMQPSENAQDFRGESKWEKAANHGWSRNPQSWGGPFVRSNPDPVFQQDGWYESHFKGCPF